MRYKRVFLIRSTYKESYSGAFHLSLKHLENMQGHIHSPEMIPAERSMGCERPGG